MAEIRLICPVCGAQYRIPETAIPPNGREVECSACGKVWHAEARVLRLEAPVARRAVAEPPAEEPRLSRKLPDSVLDILRDEVEYERRARASDAAPTAAAPVSPERPRPLPETEWPATTITEHVDPRTTGTGMRDPVEDAAPAPAVAPAAADATPQPAAETAPLPLIRLVPVLSNGPAASGPSAPRHAPPRAARRAYAAGFGLAVLIAASLIALYALAPALPEDSAFGEGLAQFRAQVDAARMWIQDRAGDLAR